MQMDRQASGARLPAPETASAPSPDDMALVARSGDRAAFARLFAFYAPRVKAFMRRRGVGEAQAEDLAQEVMARLWRKAGHYDPRKSALSTWVFVLARNVWIDGHRRGLAQRAPDEGDLEPAAVETPESDYLLGERERRVQRALRALPPEQRQILRLSFYEGLSQTEISERLNLPLGTVKSRMRLALGKIRLGLGPV